MLHVVFASDENQVEGARLRGNCLCDGTTRVAGACIDFY